MLAYACVCSRMLTYADAGGRDFKVGDVISDDMISQMVQQLERHKCVGANQAPTLRALLVQKCKY
jgi:hypothetical protein